MEALPAEAPPFSAHEASAGVRQPEKWRKPGRVPCIYLTASRDVASHLSEGAHLNGNI